MQLFCLWVFHKKKILSGKQRIRILWKIVDVPSKSWGWGDEYKKLEGDTVMGDLRGDGHRVQGVDLTKTQCIQEWNSQRINYKQTNEKILKGCRKDGPSSAKSTCFFRGPGFGSQHGHGGLQMPGTCSRVFKTPLYNHQALVWCTYTHPGKARMLHKVN